MDDVAQVFCLPKVWEKDKKMDAVTEAVQMPRELTDEQADAAMRATAVHLDIKGSQLTVNREKMKARYRALVKFMEAQRAEVGS